MRFVSKPVEIDAFQWRKNGDHPEDGVESSDAEGKIVRYFRSANPDKCAQCHCKECGAEFAGHGWIDTLEGGHIVCPGDFIITGVAGERYPCKPGIFHSTYDRVDAREVGDQRAKAFMAPV